MLLAIIYSIIKGGTMKQAILGLITISLIAAINTYAAVSTSSAPSYTSIPNLKSGFEFTAEGFYLTPVNSDLDYAAVINSTLSSTNTASMQKIKPGYGLGFRIGAGYIYPNSGNDVRLSWMHLNTSDSQSITAGDGQAITPPFNTANNFLGFVTFNQGQGSAKFNYDAIDLDAGQFVNFGTYLQMRMFAGLRYANIKRNLFSGIYDTVYKQTFDINNYSRFSGLGPRAGIDAAYQVSNHFGIVSHIGVALLLGKIKTAAYIYAEGGSSLPGASLGNAVDLIADNVYRILPGIDAKLGVNYSYQLANNSVFTVEAGYQVTQYWNAIDRLNFTGPTSPNSLNITSINRVSSGIGLYGPYLSVNLKV